MKTCYSIDIQKIPGGIGVYEKNTYTDCFIAMSSFIRRMHE